MKQVESQQPFSADLRAKMRARVKAFMDKNDPDATALVDNLNRNAVKSATDQANSRKKPGKG